MTTPKIRLSDRDLERVMYKAYRWIDKAFEHGRAEGLNASPGYAQKQRELAKTEFIDLFKRSAK